MIADALVRLYRLIPFRGLLHPWFPTPTSHLYQAGDGWGRIFRLIQMSGESTRPPMP